jgi:hypothetical protein
MFEGLQNLKALDLGGNELKSLDENIFQSFPSLEYLNLRHNYIQSINANLLDCLGNLEFLSLINGYYDSNDEFSIDFDSLNLPKLKYLAVRANCVPEFKNLRLEFLEIKGLKEENLWLENLRKQSALKGVRLVFNYETSSMPALDEKVFKSLDSLVFLAFRFDYLFDARDVLDNKDFYKCLIRRENTLFYDNHDEFSYSHCLFSFTVSQALTLLIPVTTGSPIRGLIGKL